MSWQAYTDSLISSGKIDRAAIYSAAGDSVWAQTNYGTISGTEINALIHGYVDPSSLYANGLHLGSEKFFVIRSDERSIYGKKNEDGIIIAKTKQAILIGHYSSGVQAGEAAIVIENLADYLIGLGY